MVTKSLKKRILIPLVILLVCVALVTSTLIFISVHAILSRQLKNQIELARDAILSYIENSSQPDDLQRIILSFNANLNIQSIFVITDTPYIFLASSRIEWLNQKLDLTDYPYQEIVQRFTNTKGKNEIKIFGKKSIEYFTRFNPAFSEISINRQCILHLCIDLTSYNYFLINTIILSILIALAVIILLTFSSYIMLRKYILKPATMIHTGVSQYAAGNKAIQIPVVYQDEVGFIAEQINYLMNAINTYETHLIDYQNQLKKQVKQQTRELTDQNQKLQEQASLLAENDYKFRTLTKNLPEIIIRFNKELRCLYINDVIVELTGKSADFYFGKTLENLKLPLSILDLWYEKLPLAFNGNSMINIEYEFPGIKGSRYHFTHIMPERRTNGPAENILVICNDITAIKTHEKELLEKEERFRQLIENSYDVIIILDDKGIQRFVSDSAAKVLGYDPAELTNIPVLTEMIHPEDQPAILQAFQDAIFNERSQGRIQYRHRHKNGSWIYLEAVATNHLKNPIIRGIIANIRDISEQKLFEKSLQIALRLTNEFQKKEDTEIIDYCLKETIKLTQSQIGFFHLFSENGGTIAHSAYSPKRTPGDTIPHALFDPFDPGGICANAIRQQQPLIVNKYSETLQRFISVPVIDNGKIRALMGICNSTNNYSPVHCDALTLIAKNVWEVIIHKRFQQQLEKNEEKYRFLVQMQGEGICIVNSSEIFEFANPAAEKIFETPPGGLVGKSLANYLDDKEYQEIRHQTELRLRGIQSSYELKIITQKSNIRYIFVTATPHYDNNHNFIATYGIFMDITERKHTEHALIDSKVKQEKSIETNDRDN